jgi:hypothetical protein
MGTKENVRDYFGTKIPSKFPEKTRPLISENETPDVLLQERPGRS